MKLYVYKPRMELHVAFDLILAGTRVPFRPLTNGGDDDKGETCDLQAEREALKRGGGPSISNT